MVNVGIQLQDLLQTAGSSMGGCSSGCCDSIEQSGNNKSEGGCCGEDNYEEEKEDRREVEKEVLCGGGCCGEDECGTEKEEKEKQGEMRKDAKEVRQGGCCGEDECGTEQAEKEKQGVKEARQGGCCGEDECETEKEEKEKRGETKKDAKELRRGGCCGEDECETEKEEKEKQGEMKKDAKEVRRGGCCGEDECGAEKEEKEKQGVKEARQGGCCGEDECGTGEEEKEKQRGMKKDAKEVRRGGCCGEDECGAEKEEKEKQGVKEARQGGCCGEDECGTEKEEKEKQGEMKKDAKEVRQGGCCGEEDCSDERTKMINGDEREVSCCGEEKKERQKNGKCCDDEECEEGKFEDVKMDKGCEDECCKNEGKDEGDGCCGADKNVKGKGKGVVVKEKAKEMNNNCEDACCGGEDEEDDVPLIVKRKEKGKKDKKKGKVTSKYQRLEGEVSTCKKGCCEEEENETERQKEEEEEACGKGCCPPAPVVKGGCNEKDACCADDKKDFYCVSIEEKEPTEPTVLICCTVCWNGSCCNEGCCSSGCCVTASLSYGSSSLQPTSNVSWRPSWFSFSGWNQLKEVEEEEDDIKLESPLAFVPISPSSSTVPPSSLFVQIGGMTCTDCATSIEKCLSKLPGVTSSEITYMTSKGKVTFNSLFVNEANILAQICKLGFSAEAMQSDSVTTFNISYASEPMPRYADDLLNSVLKMPGVLEARIDVRKHTLHITHDFSVLSPRSLSQCVRNAGWNPTPASGSLSNNPNDQLQWQWKWRFLVGCVLSVPVILISYVFPLIDATKSFTSQDVAPGLSLGVLVSWLFSTPIQFWLAGHLYSSAFKSLFYAHKANVDCLVMLSSSAAYVYSALSVIVSLAKGRHIGESFFETCAILLTLIMLGRFVEVYAKEKTRKNLTHLVSAPRKCSVVNPDGTITSDEEVEWLGVGDVQQVVVGEQIAADGVVIFGSSEVDQSVLTGESVPVFKAVGDSVCSGSINLHGMLHVKITKRAQESTLTQIRKLVEDAQSTSAPIQQIADKLSSYFIAFILVLTLIVFIVWISISSSLAYSLRFTISMLVVACPCAIALSVPSAIMVGLEMGAKNGILYKEGGQVIEKLNTADIIVFDKTGTLTNGTPGLVHYSLSSPFPLPVQCSHPLRENCKECEEKLFFQLVGSAESASEHPVAKAIAKYAKGVLNKDLNVPNDFVAVPGRGLSCEVDGFEVHLGNKAYMNENGVNISPVIFSQLQTNEARGETVICAAINRLFVGMISLKDTPKPEARSVIESLARQGKEVWMISGDNTATATAIGHQLGINNIMGDVLPAAKADKVKELQQTGGQEGKKRIVVMVGDGVNDAPALAQADVGIAIGAGTDIAIEAADCVLMHSNLHSILTTFHLSQKIFSTIKRNLIYSLMYNLVAIFIASGAGHLFMIPSSSFFFHVLVEFPPSVAGASELLSSVPVLISSSLLYYYSA